MREYERMMGDEKNEVLEMSGEEQRYESKGDGKGNKVW